MKKASQILFSNGIVMFSYIIFFDTKMLPKVILVTRIPHFLLGDN